MTLVKEILEVNWSEPFEITMCEDKDASDCISCLQKKFGHPGFREMQWKVVASVLNDRLDNCVVMATGYGKSLCYQFPSVYLDTITIVVSPLISLMQDQVLAMRLNNLRACYLGSAQENRDTVYEVIDRQYNVVYVTPEYITSEAGEFLLSKIREHLTLIAIDEAHCISKWGHDFRSAYRNLSRLRDMCPNVPIFAMTATATPLVRNDIIHNLKLRNPQIILTGFDRPNLEFGVRYKTSIWADIGPHIAGVRIGSAIIYCISRRVTEEVAAALMANGHPCAVYHAGISLAQRKKTHENFIHDRIRVICATIAFGMGINKPDVRLIIHYGVAQDVESYYQEVGRAGRDGLPSKCLMFYENKDWSLRSMIRNNSKPTVDTQEHQQKLMENMRQYVCTNSCRRRFILSYFGENCDKLEARSNCCDNCKRQNTPQNLFDRYEGLCADGVLDITAESMKLLTLVKDNKATFGMHKALLILKGSKSKSVPDQCLRHPLYGSLSGKSIKWLEAVGNYLQNTGMILTLQCKTGWSRCYTVCVISAKGSEQLQKGDPIRIVPGDDFIRLLKIKVKSLPKILAARPSDNQQSVSKATLTTSSMTVTPTDSSDLNEIYRPLMRMRTKLANMIDVMPYLVASTKALQQLATSQPTSMDELKKLELDGYSEDKIQRFGPFFLKVIRDFHAEITKSVKKEGATMTNTIINHLVASEEPSDRPSTSSHNLVRAQCEHNHIPACPPAPMTWTNNVKTESLRNPQEKCLGPSMTETNNIKTELPQSPEEKSPSPPVTCMNNVKTELSQSSQENSIVSTQGSVEWLDPSPPPVIEISDSETEDEDKNENWDSDLRDSELLLLGEEFDEKSSDNTNEELDMLLAALKKDPLCPTRTENEENIQPLPTHAVQEEPNISRTQSNPRTLDNKASGPNHKLAETSPRSIANVSTPIDVDFHRDVLEDLWDTDVDDLDLTQISEKAEQEVQATSSSAHFRENGSQSNSIPPQQLPSLSCGVPSLRRVKSEKEDTELDLFLDAVQVDLNQNYRATHEKTQKAVEKVRVIQKTSNAFEYEDDSSSDSDCDSRAVRPVISPKKRSLPSWMQLTNKRRS